MYVCLYEICFDKWFHAVRVSRSSSPSGLARGRNRSSPSTGSGKLRRDEAKEEAQAAQLAAIMVGDAKEPVEDELARVQDALTVVEEARHMDEAEVARLEVERTSLLLEIGATKDEVSSLIRVTVG